MKNKLIISKQKVFIHLSMNETRKRKYSDEYQEKPNKFRAVEKEENIKELSLFAKIKNWFMSLIK